jgi:hypothetical protein
MPERILEPTVRARADIHALDAHRAAFVERHFAGDDGIRDGAGRVEIRAPRHLGDVVADRSVSGAERWMRSVTRSCHVAAVVGIMRVREDHVEQSFLDIEVAEESARDVDVARDDALGSPLKSNAKLPSIVTPSYARAQRRPCNVMRALFGASPSSAMDPPTDRASPTVARSDSISMRSPRNRSVPLISSMSCGIRELHLGIGSSAVLVRDGRGHRPVDAIATSITPRRAIAHEGCNSAASMRPRVDTSMRLSPRSPRNR